MTMEIITKAYSFLFKEYISEISDEIFLKDNEILSMGNLHESAKDFFVREGFQRQKYEYKLLDEHHTRFAKTNAFIMLTFNINSRPQTIYISLSEIDYWKLRWMNKKFWIQKDDNWWKPVALIIGLIATYLFKK